MTLEPEYLVERLHLTLVEEIRSRRPQYLLEPFTVAEIYQDLVPYRSHRDRIGASMNGDYEHAILRLLAGEGGFVTLESDQARRRMAEELESNNPNTGIFREFAALDVRLNPSRIPPEQGAAATEATNGHGKAAESPVPRAQAAPDQGAALQGLEVRTSGQSEGGRRTADLRSGPSGSGPSSSSGSLERQPVQARRRPDASKDSPASAEASSTHVPANCRWCREEMPKKDNLRFCPFCGMDVNLVPCQACGEELEPNWRFCITCGAQAVTED